MQAAIAERDRLRAEINMLKSTTVGDVDMRPLGAQVRSDPTGGPTVILMPEAQLFSHEREALQDAISPELLTREEWSEGPDGELYNHAKRPIYKRGYASAIRKILGLEPFAGKVVP
jgi:hypothetical protein